MFEFIGCSDWAQQLRAHIAQVASHRSSVLITGDSGTGKELIARAIHARSPRADAPLVCVDCASIPASLFASTLFGHVKGAFTGAGQSKVGLLALADGGTVFMDELGDVPLPVQAKLLRVLEHQEVLPVGGSVPTKINVRILAATHSDLLKQVNAGQFRHDLYFRLNVVTLSIPPLRERRDDIPLLFSHFLTRAVERFKRDMPVISPTVQQHLMTHNWPGNVRELSHFAERVALGVEGSSGQPVASTEQSGFALPERLERYEAEILKEALRAQRGDVKATIEALGIPRKTFYDKLQRHGINRADYAERGAPEKPGH